jgi:hypothetical protein
MSSTQGMRIQIGTVDALDDYGYSNSTYTLGDLNGDGFDDIAIGDQLLDSTYVVFGRATGGDLSLTTMKNSHTSDGFRMKMPGNTFGGTASSTSTDVNGDGYMDLIVGNPYMSLQNNGYWGGYFTILGHAGAAGTDTWGNLEMTWGTTAAPTPTVKYSSGALDNQMAQYTATIDTSASSNNTFLGAKSTVNVGDVNGDGLDDVLLLASRQPTTTYSGAAYLVYGTAIGATTPTLTDFKNLTSSSYAKFSATGSIELLGGNAWENFSGVDGFVDMSTSTNNIGDINGDGINDFAIGSYEWDASGSTGNGLGQGRVYVMYGKGSNYSNTNLDTTGLTGSNGFILTTSTHTGTNIQTGFSLSSGGDTNGDGLDDFIVTAPGANGTAGTNSGVAYLVYGQNGASPFAASTNLDTLVSQGKAVLYQGTAAGDYFGTGADLVDRNGDGIADLFFGASHADATNAANAGSFITYSGSIKELTQGFTNGADTIAAGGTSPGAAAIVGGVDRISGGSGNDTITGIGIASDTGNNGLFDVAYGGQGNDTIALSGTNFTRVEGGAGIDTLRFDFSSQTLDLATMGNKVKGFEHFDLGSGGNTFKLRLGDVINQSDETGVGTKMMISGTSGTVDLAEVIGAGGWSNTGNTTVNGQTYNIYHHAGVGSSDLHDVLIQQGLTVS